MARSTRDAVLAAILQVCADKGLPARTLADGESLGEGGLALDSLDMATVVAELEVALQKDPFAEATPRFRTVGELIALYEPDGTS